MENNKKAPLVRVYHDFPISQAEIISPKIFRAWGSNHRMSGHTLYECSEENLTKAREHNDILTQIEELQERQNEIVKSMAKYEPEN